MINKSGVYKITNINTGNFYIGSSEKIEKRFIAHKSQLKRNIHNNTYLQNSWNKYGEDNFIFEILIECLPCDTLKYEQEYINSLKPKYNILKIAGSLKGFRHSEESRKKISLAGIGRFVSEETRKKRSLSTKGTPKPKVSESQKGRKMSEAQKKILSSIKTGIKTGENPKTFKPVNMLDKITFQLIRSFPSLKHALQFLNKPTSSKSCISRCCKGINQTYCGYRWSFINKNKYDK